MTDAQILSLANACIGLLFVALSVPLMLRRVKRNRWFGVRFQAAYASDEDWYAINAYGGKWLFGNGLFLIGVGVFGLLNPPQERYELWLALAPLSPLILCIPCYRYSKARSK